MLLKQLYWISHLTWLSEQQNGLYGDMEKSNLQVQVTHLDY